MSFRDREKARQTALKGKLFSAGADVHGQYLGRSYPFCIGGEIAGENLHADHRLQAISYFRERHIGWHGGQRREHASDLPSRHLCCSQSMCVNVLFPFMWQPMALKLTLADLGYSVSEVLRFAPNEARHQEPGYIAFEWIGLCNYLGEHSRGRVATYVSVLHVAPYQNQELMRAITSPEMRSLGDNIHSVWSALVLNGRFKGVSMREMLASAVRHQNSFGLSSGKYIEERYGGM